MEGKQFWIDMIVNTTGNNPELVSLTHDIADRFPPEMKEAVYKAVSHAAFEYANPANAVEAGLVACYMILIGSDSLKGLSPSEFEEAAVAMGIKANHAGSDASKPKLSSIIKCAKTAYEFAPESIKGRLELDILRAENVILREEKGLAYSETPIGFSPSGNASIDELRAENALLRINREPAYSKKGVKDMDQMSARLVQAMKSYALQ